MTPRPQLHATSLNIQCGEAFRRRYLEGEIIPPGVAALVGSATDRAVTKNLQHKITTHGDLLPVEDVAETARDSVVAGWQSGVKLDADEAALGPAVVKGHAADKAVRLAVLHAQQKAPVIQPTHVQRRWTLELRGFPVDLAGTLDIQEVGSVRDTKTSAKAPSEFAAQTSMQLTAYHLAVGVIDGTPPASVSLDYLVDTKQPKVITLTAVRDRGDYQALLNRVEMIAKAIETGTFLPVSPDHWMCTPKWCGYFDSCRYALRPKTAAVTSAF